MLNTLAAPPPVITVQPANAIVQVGDTAIFDVEASSSTTLSYQWYFQGAPISGATTNIYLRINAQLTNAGSYYAAVQNAGGTVNSASATLTVVTNPVVEFDNASNTSTNGTTINWSHTVGTGPNRILMVGVTLATSTRTVTSATYAGQNLTLVGEAVDGTGKIKSSLWRLLSPPPGTAKVTVTASSSGAMAGGSVSFTNVSQATPLGTFASAGGLGLTASVNISSATNEVVFDLVGATGDSTSLTVGNNQLQRWNKSTGTSSTDAAGASSTEIGAASITMSWTLGVSKSWAIGGVSLKLAPPFSQQSDVRTTQTGPSSVIAGGNYVCSILVTNAGLITATNILVTDSLPSGTSFFTASGGGISNNEAVTWPSFDLPSGASTNFTITLTAPARGSLTNIVSSTSGTYDSDVSNNDGSSTNATVITTITSYDASFANSSCAKIATNNTLSWPLTVASGGNRMLIVGVSLRKNTSIVTNLTYGGVALTNIASSRVRNGVEIWGLAAPPVGTANVAVSWTNSSDVVAWSGVFTNVDLSGPIRATNVANGSGSPATVVIGSQLGDLVVDTASLTGDALSATPGGGQTSICNDAIGINTADGRGASSYEVGGGSTTMSWTLGGNKSWEIAAVVLKATPVPPQADVATTVTGPSSVLAISNLTYTVSVTNAGPFTATNVVASDVLPAGVTFLNASSGGVYSNGIVKWTGFSLAYAAKTNLTVTVAPPLTGTLTNSALSTADTSDLAVANNDGSASAAKVVTTVINSPATVNNDNYTALEDTVLTVPAGGVLTNDVDPEGQPLNATLVTGTSFGILTLNSNGGFSYTPNANYYGSDSFTYRANDGITSSVPATVNITVTAVNDAPAGTPKTVTTLEDIPYVFSSADFGFTDPNDSPSNTLLAVKISALPAAGSLTDNGVAVTTGQFIPVADVNGGLLRFTPATNANGSPYTTFTFQVQDNGGTANGGVNLDPTPKTMTVNVISVNDPPSGTSKTISTLEDTAYTFATGDFGFTDPSDSPANSLLAVKISTLPAAGTLKDNGVAVTTGQFIPLADITGGLLKYMPATNANGTPYTSFTFQVQDNGGTVNGGADLDPSPKTLTVNVTPVNDAPVGTSTTVTTLEDTPYLFSAADFGFSDPIDSPANVLLAVKITTLPALGTLKDNGVAVTTGQFIPVADINGGLLRFTPATNANGSPYTSFTFQVQDNGGTANGGIDLDQTPRTVTVNVTPLNDPPSGAPKTVTILEDGIYTFAAADFGFTDSADSPPNTLLAVKITTLPAAGTLTDNGTAVTTGQFIPVADLNSSLLRFTPAANANGTPYASFTFQVQDNGGTANGGVNLDPSPKSFTVNVTSVNDSPVGTPKTVTTLEDTPYIFGAADFGFTDPQDSPPNALLAVKVTTLPTAGSLTDNGVAVITGQSIPVADINSGLLRLAPAANTNAAPYSTFTFQVQDNGGTANGGVDLDSIPRSMTINVTSVNDAPLGTSKTVTTLEDTAYTFAAADFGFSDPTDFIPNALLAVKISALPAVGTLTDNGAAVTSGQFVPVADITAGLLRFLPATNANGTPYASFTFQVQDNGGTANGGIDLDPGPKTLTVNVTSVNDAPSGTPKTVTTLEDAAYTFVASDFGFTDPSDSPANVLLAVKVSALPSKGSLTDNGVAVTTGQFIPVADVNAGLLRFMPVGNSNGAPYTTFTFQVQDNGGTVNGGVDLDPSPKTMTVNVTSVNDAPAGAPKTVTTLEDTPYAFAAADFGFTDTSDSPPNTLLAVQISSLPAVGSLTDIGVPVSIGQKVPVADINAGFLLFTPVGNSNATPYASYTFQVQDNGGTSNGGVDLDPVARTMTINVTSVNDAPSGTAKAVTILEDTPYFFAASDFGFSDTGDSPANTLSAVKISTLPSGGTISDAGVAVTNGQFISVADVNAGLLKFLPATNANGTPYTSFNFQVQDNGGTANGGSNLDPTPKAFTFNVTSVNDPPIGTSTTVTTLEEVTYTFAAADFGFTDPADSPPNALMAVKITTLPLAGSLTDNGVAVTTGQMIPLSDLNSGLLRFAPATNANGMPYVTFTFQVQDNGGTANGGIDLDPNPKTMAVNVTSVNDAPSGTSKSVTTLEDTPYVFVAADFGFSDPSDSPTNAFLAVKLSSLPAVGTLTDNGVIVTNGQFIPVVDINSGLLRFAPALNAYGTPYASFNFQVQDDGGTANGGIDLDLTPNTLSINVIQVNDAPSGTSKSVTILEDNPYIFASADFGFSDTSDSPTNAFIAVKITTLPAVGILTDNGVAVTNGQFISVADLDSSLLRFMPAVNSNGTPYTTFTFQVQDNGGTANAGVDVDPFPKTFTVNVTSVNDAPSGTSKTVTTLEDTPYTFTAADFGFTDTSDSPPNTFLTLKISSLPAVGTLTDNGVAVTNSQMVPVVDINGGLLRFSPALNSNGTAYASFTFQVQDNGGTANGGTNLDPNPKTMTVNVTSVNDAPAGAPKTVTILEDASYTFAAADFGFSDTSDSPPNTLLAVKVTTLPSVGSLTDNGVAVTTGQFIPVADVNGGLLRFSPVANSNGTPYASFTFQVQDNGGTANGGVDVDPTPRTFTVNVTSVNDAPSGTSKTVTTLEDTTYTFAAADFGFTDTSDSPTNAFSAVKISSLPAAGTLTDNAVAVTNGQFVTIADLTNGLLRFAPATNANGSPYASFTFQVQDNGGTANGGANLDPSARTMTVNVTSVNDSPTGTSKTLTTLEDTPYIFTAADFGFSDPNDSPANTLLTVKVTTLPAAGSLTDNGVAVTTGQFVPVADVNGGLLRFLPATNANAAPYTTFTFQVQDNGGTANGGIDLDPTPRTFTVNVTSVNDAPSGTSKTVTTLEDTPFTFTAADFGFTDISDSPANTLLAVKISNLPAVGSLTDNGAAVTTGQFITLADVNGGLLRFTPVSNSNGAPYASFTFQVQDNGGTANGGVDLDQSPKTMTVNVTSVNDAPSGAPKTVTTLEDTPYTFAAADFGFSDTSDSPTNAFSAVKISSLPAVGTLTDNAVAVTNGQFVTFADLTNGLLRFAPAANANGSPYTSFTFQVQDDGGTANGGANLDPTPRTMTVNVTPVNDAPAGASKTVTILEDTSYVFAAADFGFTDVNDSPANTLLAVKISTLPAAGTFTDNGVAVTVGQFVPLADLNGGLLRFSPATNANATPYAAFTFQVQDNGGTANGGVNLDPLQRSFTINVTSVNDAPTGTSKTVTTLEDTPYVFAAADFGFSDPNDSPANTLLAVKISSLPAAGSLTDNGVAVTTGQFVTIADLTNGLLRFAPAANTNASPYASFTFQVQDNGGTANGGIDLDPTARTITVNVTPVNDAPIGTPKTVTTLEDTSYTFAAADFGFTDPNDFASNTFLALKISSLPAAGVLKDNGVTVTNGQFIPVADLNSNLVQFVPATNANGSPYASFTFQVQDNGGTANGGVDLDPTPRALTINVTSVNDSPVGTSKTVTTLEDTPYTFTASDFGFSDPNDSPPNTLLAVKISSLPAAGSLTDNGLPVTAGQFIPLADINGGLLRFGPAANVNATPYANFTFQVQDNGGTANGGVDLDPNARTMTVNVTSVNDAPSGSSKTVTILEDTSYTFAVADFGFSDANDSPSNTFVAVKISSLPTAGAIKDNGVTVTNGQFIPVGDLTSNLVKFVPATNANGTPYASFTFQVQDNGGTANGGVDLDPAPDTFTINVTSVNDAPSGTAKTVTTLEDTAYIFAAADFGFSDVNDSPANTLLAVKITTLPAAGSLTDNGVAVTSGQFIPVADLNSNLVRFLPATNANGTPYASFTFQVQDNGGTANGGVDLDPVADTFTINVTSVNDAPSGVSKTVTTLEDTPYTFAAADFGFSDTSDSPANTFSAVKISSLPAAGSLTDNAVAVTNGQFVTIADLTNGLLRFAPAANSNGSPYASFTFQVQDNGGTANGGVNLDPSARTMTVNVTSVNDAPSGTSKTVTTLEDIPYVFAAADFGFSDNNDSPANTLLAVKISTLPAAGSLTDNGVAVTTGQFIPVADVNGGLLRFSPATNANGSPYANFTFQVQDNGGTANGGVDLDPSARTMTVNVTSVNDAPSGTSKTVTTLEDTAYTFAAADFGFSDASDSPANTLLAVKISTLPATGSLTDNGVAVTTGQFIPVADVNGGLLKYAPVTNTNGSPVASFTFQVQDNGGTANGGVDLDPTANMMTINVTSVNDAPSGTAKTVTTLEDTPYIFASADFGFSDNNDLPTNAFASVKITTLPTAGSMTDNGVAVTNGQFILVADFDAGLVRLTPAANTNATPYSTFTFQVRDNGGTANGGVDVDPTPRSFTINVTPVNDSPAGTAKTVTILEDASYTFTSSDFGFSDVNDLPPNTLLAVKVSTLPAAGSLTDNGVAVTAGQFIPVADVNGGLLKYSPATNANATPYASFNFQVQDNGGTANGGVDIDPTPRTFTFNVTSVNDAPVGTPKTVTTLEDTPYIFALADFGFTDPSDSPTNAFSAVKISSLPTAGSLTDNGIAVTNGQLIAVSDVSSNLLRFTPTANTNASPYASFTFQVQDNGGTANGGINLDPNPKTMTVNVTSVNDAPAGTAKTVTTLEDTPYVFAAADFGFTDPNDTPPNTLLAVKISTLPAAGSLTDNGVAVTTGQFVPVADVNGGLLRFTPATNANGTPYTSFTFQVQDNGGTSNGGVDLDPSAKTFTINVTPVNDPPTGTSKTVTTLEDTTYTFTTADFGFSDTSDSPANTLQAVKISTLPVLGTLADNGVAVTAGQIIAVADITGNLLRFTPGTNGNGAPYTSFTFQVQDNGGTANGGVNTDPNPKTMTVNVTPVNDAPIATAQAVKIAEDTPKAINLIANDVDNDPLTFSIVNNPTNGVLSGFNPATGLVTYRPNTNFIGTDSFTFRVNDGTTNSSTALVSITVTPLHVTFTDVSGTPVSSYQVGDSLYVTMTDADANTSSNSAQTVSITVSNTIHGDVETILLAETGTNTGVFRSIAALPCLPGAGLAPQDGTLNGLAGNTIEVDYTDPISGGFCNANAVLLLRVKNNVLYLSDPAQSLDRIDPVATGDNTTASTAIFRSNNGWAYRKQLTFQNSTRPENLTNFPVLVHLTSANFDFTKARPNGQDVRFFDADGITPLAYQIESWDSVAQAAFVWVKVPQIDASSGTDSIWLQYGNPTAADAQTPTQVWSSNYRAVWHMNETNGTTVADASGNGWNGTPTTVGLNAAGQVAGGDAYSGSAYTTLPAGYIVPSGSTTWTFESWLYLSNSVSSGDRIFVQYVSGGTSLLLYYSSGSIFVVPNATGNNSGTAVASAPVGTAQWVHFVWTRAGSADTLYVNGISIGVAATSANQTFSGSFIGARSASANKFHGNLDEMRVSSVARSGNWVSAQYAAMTDNLITFGSEVALPGGGLSFTTFAQSPALCSSMTIPAGATVIVTNFVTVTNGVLPANPSITAQLMYGTNNIILLTNPVYSAAGSNLVWTGTVASDTTLPAGQGVALVLSNTQPYVSFSIDYDSAARPSKIILPTLSSIAVNTIGFYDAPYPGGNPLVTVPDGSDVYVRVTVFNPFGFADIASLDLFIDGPTTAGDLSAELNDSNVVVGSSRVDLQACKLEYSIVSPK